jgi:hypothetical protein
MRPSGILVITCLMLFSAALRAGEGHEVTSTDGKTTKTYMVRFGGGKLNEMATAFDPASQKFVYLHWKRDTPMPKPTGSIWLAATGETIPLFKFPDVETPLPVIATVKDLKVCPFTGDKNLKTELKMFFD